MWSFMTPCVIIDVCVLDNETFYLVIVRYIRCGWGIYVCVSTYLCCFYYLDSMYVGYNYKDRKIPNFPV